MTTDIKLQYNYSLTYNLFTESKKIPKTEDFPTL